MDDPGGKSNMLLELPRELLDDIVRLVIPCGVTIGATTLQQALFKEFDEEDNLIHSFRAHKKLCLIALEDIPKLITVSVGLRGAFIEGFHHATTHHLITPAHVIFTSLLEHLVNSTCSTSLSVDSKASSYQRTTFSPSKPFDCSTTGASSLRAS